MRPLETMYGRLRVLGSGKGPYMVSVRCDCGTVKDVYRYSLLRGLTRSCGCLREETAGHHRVTHGMNRQPEHKIWCALRSRCFNKNNKSYANYGGRGISVCARWSGVNGFENFFADMGQRPSPKYSTERKNNDGNYEPDNCVWATAKEQANNRRPRRAPSATRQEAA